jgi:uncharacterized protein (DUF983 family)
MLLVIGVYRLWPKRVAFRNDYCLTCLHERRAVHLRTFDVAHICFVPVLPVGFWKHWCCSSCGKDPHAHRGTGPALKWVAVVVLVLLALWLWLESGIPWAVRLAATVLAFFLALYLLRSPREVALRKQLAAVSLATDTICPFCGTPLVVGARWSCPGCGVVRC